ncbi:MAG: hypothetical protein JJV98_13850 [Desulfosarcina sp.]|nr:hypothetical protein [Desulfobacterales bacterium]
MRQFDAGGTLKFDGPGSYQIRIKGYLDPDRSDWIGGMQITTRNDPGQLAVTTLVGKVMDQAALSGILNTLYEMHLPLLSVEHLEDDG